MNKIVLKETNLSENVIEYKYEIQGNFTKYFTSKRSYKIKYTESIVNVPKSICNIQFVSNILPLVWIFDAELYLDELDYNYNESIDEFKNGYIKMYNYLDLKGKIYINKIIKNEYKLSSKVGAFFSGGLDATSTVVSHYEEKPLLINIQGSDVNLKYKNVSQNVKKYLKNVADNLELNITFIESEFRTLINERVINKYIKKLVHDNYWHGFQHGIAIISHAAPISYLYGLEKVYIASSFSEKNHAPCASDPTIDNFVKLSLTKVIHDGYNFDRIDKSKNVADFINKYNKKINIRVCLDDYRVDNCCKCEKCYRTIFNVAANGYDPSIIGFDLSEKDYKNIEYAIKNKIFVQYPILWKDIQKSFLEHPELRKDPRYTWIYEYDFDKVNNSKKKYIYKIYNAILKRIKRLIKTFF